MAALLWRNDETLALVLNLAEHKGLSQAGFARLVSLSQSKGGHGVLIADVPVVGGCSASFYDPFHHWSQRLATEDQSNSASHTVARSQESRLRCVLTARMNGFATTQVFARMTLRVRK
eukprot:1443144-Amphidinium_carterae.1